jgi:hypothetical protein
MKFRSFCSCYVLLCTLVATAQPNTDVYLMELAKTDSTFSVFNVKNISNHSGYDNQPSFMNKDTLLYAGSENGQTDIHAYTISASKKEQLHRPTTGGEYSPKRIPNSKHIAAVRLDTTGLQRLYKYEIEKTNEVNSQLLLSNIEVAYYAFYNENWVVASVLAGNQLDLVIANIQKDEADLYVENVGRSIHKVPNTNTVSYTIVNEEKNLDVFVLDVLNAEDTYFVCQLPIGIQDHTWIDATTLLLGSGAKLYLYDLFNPGEWQEVADLSKENIANITRIAVSPDGKHIALAAEQKFPSPAEIVDAHIAPFNNGQLEKFSNAFAKDIVVSHFPDKTMYVGKEKLKQNYARFFKNTKNWNVAVNSRIVVGNQVIDEEIVTINGKQNRQVTIYETKDGLIQSMTFIANKKSENPLPPISEQMIAYNNRDINAFMNAYSDTIKTYNYPAKLGHTGKASMKKSYAQFFETTPDLNYTVPQRIIIGNIVIDEEHITANGDQVRAVAIYEVLDGKISKVTFLSN